MGRFNLDGSRERLPHRGLSFICYQRKSIVFSIKIPTSAKTSQLRAALRPTDARGVWQFRNAPGSDTISQIATDIVKPSQQNGAGPVYLGGNPSPNGSQGFGFTETSFVCGFR